METKLSIYRLILLSTLLCCLSHSLNAQDIKRTYDEFTGETRITANIDGPLDFVKVTSESGESFVLLTWNSSSDGEPKSNNLRLIILFDDSSRLSVNLPIVCEYDEFMSNIALKAAVSSMTVIDPTWYRLKSEVILNASQIMTLKNKSIKKYRLEGYSEHEIQADSVDSQLIFDKMLSEK